MKDWQTAFNGKSIWANGVVLTTVIIAILILGISWIIQMTAMYIILPSEKRFPFWKKEEMIIEDHYPGIICTFLCNAEQTFATQILRFRAQFETVWCTTIEEQEARKADESK